MGRAMLDGVPLRIDPDSVKWSVSARIADTKTLGGKVIQILGAEVSDMEVTGHFGNGDPSVGDVGGWQEQQRFVAWIKSISRQAEADLKPVRFVYAPRGWDFLVYLKRLDQDPYANENFNPRWTLTLFIVEDSTGKVVKGVKDLYIKRLMAGVGWKQSNYNGPLGQREKDALTNGLTDEQYISAQISEASGGAIAP